MEKNVRVAAEKPQGRGGKVKTRYTNRTKVLLCYFIAWSLALLLPVMGLLWVYPYKLVGTAPEIAKNVAQVFPGARTWLGSAIEDAALRPEMNARELAQGLARRDSQWRIFVGGLGGLLWLCSLNLQLIWRSLYMRPIGVARAVRRAIRSYRVMLFGIFLLNAAGALLVYFLGMQFVGGRTAWDWLIYMNGFALNTVAAFLCFRLAAPPSISGKFAFFKRL